MTIKQILAAKGVHLGTKQTLHADPRLQVTIIKSKPNTGLVYVGRRK